MAEYIEREALVQEIERIYKAHYIKAREKAIHDVFKGVFNAIRKISAADVVEAVRCKDCKYHNAPPCPMRLSLNWTKDNDFCSYGERRNDDKTE